MALKLTYGEQYTRLELEVCSLHVKQQILLCFAFCAPCQSIECLLCILALSKGSLHTQHIVRAGALHFAPFVALGDARCREVDEDVYPVARLIQANRIYGERVCLFGRVFSLIHCPTNKLHFAYRTADRNLLLCSVACINQAREPEDGLCGTGMPAALTHVSRVVMNLSKLAYFVWVGCPFFDNTQQ